MKKHLSRLALSAAALTCAMGAQAGNIVLTFDEPIDTTFAPFADFGLMGHLDEIGVFVQSGINLILITVIDFVD